MSDHVVQFHDLVGLIDSKIAEIRVVDGELSDQDSEVIEYPEGVKRQLIEFCMRDPIRSYVFRP